METLRIKLSEIRINKKNIYEQCNIEELADSIKQYGQLENGTAYKESLEEDSKLYTLVGGHRRFLALNYLAERGDIEPYMNICLIDKPNTDQEEDLLLVADNSYRKKDTWTELKEVEIALNEYNRLVSIGQRPSGKKRDWIGNKTGMGGRKVQDLLNSLAPRPVEVTTSSDTTPVSSNKCLARTKRIIKSCRILKCEIEQIRDSLELENEERLFSELDAILEKLGYVQHNLQ